MRRQQRIPPGAVRIELPDTRQQEDYTCGVSCLQSIAGYFGLGYSEEYEYVQAMGVRSNCGSHPYHITRGADAVGLTHEECWPMSYETLQKYLDRGIPVMMMIQAWVEAWKRKRGWKGWKVRWQDGHWVVAIGYDDDGVYFEDPSLTAVRGFLSYRALDERWHDVGPYWEPPYTEHMQRYGIALWKAGHRGRSPYVRRAEWIG